MEIRKEVLEELRRELIRRKLKKRRKRKLMLCLPLCSKMLSQWLEQVLEKRSHQINKLTCTKIQEKELRTCQTPSLPVYTFWKLLRMNSTVGDGSALSHRISANIDTCFLKGT